MECCLHNTPLLFGWVLEFSHTLPRKEHSGAGGLWFWVYSAEPVKLVFAFGVDGCGLLEWWVGYPVLSTCHSPHGHGGSYLSFKIRKYKREQIGIKKKKVSSLLGQFQVHSKIERKITEISIYPLFPHVHNLPHYDIPHQSGTFCTIDESTLTCCNQLRVHSLP